MRLIGDLHQNGLINALARVKTDTISNLNLVSAGVNLVSASYALTASYVGTFTGQVGGEIFDVVEGFECSDQSYGLRTLHPSCSFAIFELVGGGGGGGGVATLDANVVASSRGGNAGNHVIHMLTKEEIGSSFNLYEGTYGTDAPYNDSTGNAGSDTIVALGTDATYVNPVTGLKQLRALGGKGAKGLSTDGSIAHKGADRNTSQITENYDWYAEGEPGSCGHSHRIFVDLAMLTLGRGGVSPFSGGTRGYVTTNSGVYVSKAGVGLGTTLRDREYTPGSGGTGASVGDSSSSHNGSDGGYGFVRIWQFLKR